MARQKSSSFQGVLVEDADPAAPTRKRAIRDVIGDMARTHDRITGANSHAGGDLIDHKGTAGHGALLGFPIWSQYIGRRLTLWASEPGKHGGEGETNILAVPIFLPGGTAAGEFDNLMIELFVSLDVVDLDRLNPHVIIYDAIATFTELGRKPLHLDTRTYPGGQQRLYADLSGVVTEQYSGGHILFVRMSPALDPPDHDESNPTAASYKVEVGTLHSVSLRSTRIGTPRAAPPRLSTSPFSVWTPSATEGLGHRSIDAAAFTDRYALNAYETIGADRNANALLEYLTGWPAGGQAAYTHEDHNSSGTPDSTNPARSRFMAHTRSLYAAEPEIEMPIFTDAMGAFKTDGGLVVNLLNPPTFGMLDWYAPWPIQTAQQSVRQISVQWPDFQTASSRLKAIVLVGSDGFTDIGTDWTASIRTSEATSITACGAFTALDANNRYWRATASAIPFLPDSPDWCELLMEKTSGGLEAINQIVLLGWHVYFDP